MRATGLNYKGEPVANAAFVFSSPDTVLRVFDDGVVFATRRKADATPARVFATSGSLQSAPDSLFVVPRADSINPATEDTIPLSAAGDGTTGTTLLQFSLFGDTLAGAPKAPVSAWLVSFQLRYRGALLSPTDTSQAYTFVIAGSGTSQRLIPTFVDSTDASGRAERGVRVRSLSTGVTEDTIFLIATARARKVGAPPVTAQTPIIIRRQ